MKQITFLLMLAIALKTGFAQNNQSTYAVPLSVKFENDTAFNTGSKIETIKTDETTVENLRVLGLVWGFLKYYHPNIATGSYDWDHELFAILPQVLAAQNSRSRDSMLVQWINKFGHFKTNKNKDEQFPNSKQQPDLAWLTSPAISNQLSQLLLQIKSAKRNTENYYTTLEFGNGYPTLKNENPYAALKFPDAGFRMLALYRYWNIIQYYFPYKYLIEEDWKNELTAFIPRFAAAKNELEYNLILLELIAKIRDTHANIWGNNAVLGKYLGARIAAPELVFIDNKAVVKSFYNESMEKETGLKKGDIIIAINGTKVEDLIATRLQTTPASNHFTQLRDIATKLLRTNDTVLNIMYLRDGIAGSTALKTYPLGKVNFYMKEKQDSCFKMISPEIGYIYLGSIKSKYLPAIFESVKNTKGIIIDLRCYPFEFVALSMGQYLVPAKTEFAKLTDGSAEWPGLFTFAKPVTVGQENKAYYKGKIVILVNEYTQSQAEYTAMAFKASPNATIVGSATAGADGNVKQFYLPGGVLTMISGKGVYYPNGGETQRVGIVPDIEMKPTIEGIKKEEDEVLNKAIEIINK